MAAIRLAPVEFSSEEVTDLQADIAAHVAKHGADAPRRKPLVVRIDNHEHHVDSRAASIEAQAEREADAIERMASYDDNSTPVGRKTQRNAIDLSTYMPWRDVVAKYAAINGFTTPSIRKENPFAPNVDCLAKRMTITADIATAPKEIIDSMVTGLAIRSRRETTRKARAATTARNAAARAARTQAQVSMLRDQLIAKAREIVIRRRSA